MAAYRKAIELDPTNAAMHGTLGSALLTLGRYEEAEASTRRAIDLLPSDHAGRAAAAAELERCRRLRDLERRFCPRFERAK